MKIKLTFEWDFDKKQWTDHKKFIEETEWKFDGDPVTVFHFLNDITWPALIKREIKNENSK